jgi:hypothetical protein
MDNSISLRTLSDKFHKLVSEFNIHPDCKRFWTTPQHDGSPHVEREGNCYYYVVTERGSERERIATKDPDEILYLLVRDVTFAVAIQYELNNRIEGKDGRAMFFPYQEKLLSEIKPEWGDRKRKEHLEVLKKHPFGT